MGWMKIVKSHSTIGKKDVSSRTGYPIRVAKDAVADANELLTARHILMVEYHELWKKTL
ncbi:hypothetical protein GCM10020331_000900 [Ectobacillus funiculus]